MKKRIFWRQPLPHCSRIEDKQYTADLIARAIPADRIRSCGFAFRGKEVLIDGQKPPGSGSGYLSEYSLSVFHLICNLEQLFHSQ